jgi:broad specificity phosphatase PhoE
VELSLRRLRLDCIDLYQLHRIDPKVPVPQWELSDLGRARVETLAQSGWLSGTAHIVTSAETKAIQTAKILATALGIDFKVRPAMHENDRSATGFLEPNEFEATADLFFSNPTKSVRGWEIAVRAQVRIVTEVEAALSDSSAMAQWGPCFTATMQGSRSAGTTINLPAAETTSPSA